MEDQDFALFIQKVKSSTSVDLSQYKETQMKRRLTSFRDKKGFSTFKAFYEAMSRDKELLNEFFDRMTINVSEFWRNRQRWEMLRDRFLQTMTKQNSRLKCWSAACSTGEEPYTLAMILDRLGVLSTSSITATDIDEKVLGVAKQGIYQERSIREIPKDYLTQYLHQTGDDEWTVADHLKRVIHFQRQNLLVDRFDAGYDLIICRNVTIYFTDEAKASLYEKFAQALKPGGVLFVGSTEQIFSPSRYGLESSETFFYTRT